VSLFHQFLQSKSGLKGQVDLLNLATPGATTGGDVVVSQLPIAVAELEARNGDKTTKNDVKVVTLSAGGYDLFAHILVCLDGPTEDCVNTINEVRFWSSLAIDEALNQLGQAAGPETRIVLVTYSNALTHPDCELHSLAPIWDIALEGDASLGVADGLNDVIRSLAASHGADVAEVSGFLTPTELQSDCFNPNDAGHALIAQRFAEAFQN